MKSLKRERQPSQFDLRCYDILCQVPRGKVATYELIAHALGSKGSRAVGNAMNRNPFAPKVPCHRVVRSDGSIGGYAGGPAKKRSMLTREGVAIKNGKVEDLAGSLFAPRRERRVINKKRRV